MNIIYMSKACSKKTFDAIYNKTNGKIGQQIQKYHKLLINGFSEIENVNITAVSLLPYPNMHKGIIKALSEREGNTNFEYITYINYPILRQATLLISSFLKVKNTSNIKDTVIICDVLNISLAISAVSVAKITGKKTIGIVTDVPGLMVINEENNSLFINIKNRLLSKINLMVISNFDSYIFLTQQMNEVLNLECKPYAIIEGMVDFEMDKVINELSKKYEKKICLYAGILSKKYGVDRLVQSFLKLNMNDVELHLYGNGPYEDELTEICKANTNIHFYGIKPNDYIVQEEMKATLLINPRPTNEEYTKYSFPSKNMEYMVSGTPILTTKLPGMPEDYYPFVYLIEDETTQGLTKTLEEILSKTREELQEKGKSAKRFVLKHKNNITQTKKIMGLIEKLITRG